MDGGIIGRTVAGLHGEALGVVARELREVLLAAVPITVGIGIVEARIEAVVPLAVAVVVDEVALLGGGRIDRDIVVVAVAALLDQPGHRIAREDRQLDVAVPIAVGIGVVVGGVAAVGHADADRRVVVVRGVTVAVAGHRPQGEVADADLIGGEPLELELGSPGVVEHAGLAMEHDAGRGVREAGRLRIDQHELALVGGGEHQAGAKGLFVDRLDVDRQIH